jgi:hypothetical protein
LVLVVASCGGGGQPRGKLVVSLAAAADSGVTQVAFKVVPAAASCSAPAVASATAPLATDGGAGEASTLEVPPGTYRVCATPLGADGQPSATLPVSSTTVTVGAGETVTTTLTLQCAGSCGDAGAPDAVADAGADTPADAAPGDAATSDAGADAQTGADAADSGGADAHDAARGSWDGGALFVLAASYSHGTTTVADVDGDRKPDLIYVTPQANNNGVLDLSVWRGHGDGTFASTAVKTHVDWMSLETYWADFTGDGRLDLIAVDGFSSAGLQGGGGQWTFHLATGQADGSFAVTGPILVQAGTANMLNWSPCPGTADLNGDAVPDLPKVATVPGGSNSAMVEVFSYAPSGAFGPISQQPSPLAVSLGIKGSVQCSGVGDFDGDHKGDLVLLATAQGLSGPASISYQIAYGKGDGTFVMPTTADTLPLAGGESVDGVGDFDGDGNVDILVGDVMNHFRIIWSDGRGAFASGPMLFAFAGVGGDFDADRHVDLIGGSGNQTTISFGDGARAFPRTKTLPLAVLDSVDLDLDGATDLVWSAGTVQDMVYVPPQSTLIYLSTAVHGLAGPPDLQCTGGVDGGCEGPSSF